MKKAPIEFITLFFHGFFTALNIEKESKKELLKKTIKSVEAKINYEIQKNNYQNINDPNIITALLSSACLDLANAIIQELNANMTTEDLNNMLENIKKRL